MRLKSQLIGSAVCLDRHHGAVSSILPPCSRPGVDRCGYSQLEAKGAVRGAKKISNANGSAQPATQSVAAALGQLHQLAQRSLLLLARVTFQVASQEMLPNKDLHCARAGR
jgi:hypothetical protein